MLVRVRDSGRAPGYTADQEEGSRSPTPAIRKRVFVCVPGLTVATQPGGLSVFSHTQQRSIQHRSQQSSSINALLKAWHRHYHHPDLKSVFSRTLKLCLRE